MTKAKPRKRGRPSSFNNEVATEICRRLTEGESLRKICKDTSLPAISTVMGWLCDGKHADFSEQYAHAREAGMDAMAEEILEISDDGSNDWMERLDKDGESNGWLINGEHVQRSRLRVDTRKWYLSKLAPKKYGDRLNVDHGVQNSLAEVLKAVDGKTRGLNTDGD